MARSGLLAGLVVASMAAAGPLSAQSIPGSQSVPGSRPATEDPSRRQTWLIPSQVPEAQMRTTVIRPKGPGPFPLVVVNHGSTQNEIRRVAYRSPERDFEAIARWFVERGHVVAIPQRPGHGETGGPYLENQGGCDNADFRKAGLATAASIQAAIDYLTAQPFVRPDGVIIVGHSAGGWGALALASQNPRTVRAVINFSGGRGGRVDNRPDSNCAPDRLVTVAGELGQTARIPTLWIYSDNDTYFQPGLSARMAGAFRSAGGRAEFHMVAAFKQEGHFLVNSRDGVAIWAPLVAAFLARNR